jgi:hypothetical protein
MISYLVELVLLRDLEIKLSTGFHIYSSKAGTGKTTLAKVAATIMGNTDYILHQWNQTANNLDLILAKSNDGFLVLDEIKQLKQTVLLSEIIMKIGNGSGTGRMNQDAKSSREQFKWLTYYLSTGNYPTEYFIAKRENGYMIAAEETRLYNIPMIEVKNLHGKESVQSFLTGLLHNTDKYYGIAGYEFMTKYLKNHNESSMTVMRYKNKFHAELTAKYKDKDISERLLISLAAIYAAGKMAQAFDILPKSFEPEKTIDTILEHYLETRGGNRDSFLHLNRLYDVVCTKKKQYFTFTAENSYQNQPIDDYGFIQGDFAHIVTTNFAKIYGESNYKCCAEIRKYLRQQGVLISDDKDKDFTQHSDGKRYVKIDIKRLSELVA